MIDSALAPTSNMQPEIDKAKNSSNNVIGIQTGYTNTLNNVNSSSKDHDSESEELSQEFLIALALRKKVHVNVPAEEAELKPPQINQIENGETGLYFERIGGHVLRPCKRSYSVERSRGGSTLGTFYRNQCEDTTP